MVQINAELTIADDELQFAASRSSGPGGQHVNKTSTRVTLRFDVEASAALTDEQKARLHERLAGRISKEGVLAVSSGRQRSQLANREATIERFAELLREALAQAPPRKPTRVSRRQKARRIDEKRRRGQRKQGRSRRYDGED